MAEEKGNDGKKKMTFKTIGGGRPNKDAKRTARPKRKAPLKKKEDTSSATPEKKETPKKAPPADKKSTVKLSDLKKTKAPAKKAEEKKPTPTVPPPVEEKKPLTPEKKETPVVPPVAEKKKEEQPSVEKKEAPEPPVKAVASGLPADKADKPSADKSEDKAIKPSADKKTKEDKPSAKASASDKSSADKPEDKKERKLLLVVLYSISGLLLAATLGLGWMYRQQIVYYANEKQAWLTEKLSLQGERDQYKGEVDRLTTVNEELERKMSDPVENPALREALEKVKKLQLRIKRLNRAVAAGDPAEVKRLKEELAKLEDMLNGLRARNAALALERDQYKDRVEAGRKKYEELEALKIQVENELEKAKALYIDDLTATGVKVKGGGKKIVVVDKVKKADRLRVCFSVGKNVVAEVGGREIFVKITNPKNEVLSGGGTFKIDGQEETYSVRKEIQYDNEELLVCCDYKNTESLEKGKYVAQVFMEGNFLGEESFTLE